MAPKSAYFSCQVRYRGGPPVPDVGMLFEEIIISSNGRTIERIRNAQYIQHFVHQYMQGREKKKKRKEEGFNRIEDDTFQKLSVADTNTVVGGPSGVGNAGYTVAPLSIFGAEGWRSPAPAAGISDMEENLGHYRNQIRRTGDAPAAQINAGAVDFSDANGGGWMLMKFKIASSGLLSQDKFLPVMAMPLTIQLRLSDNNRATGKGMLAYEIQRPRMHV